MIRLLQLEGSPSLRGLSRALALAMLFCAASTALLHSQKAIDQAIPSAPAYSAPTLVPHFSQAPIAPFGDTSGLPSLSTPSLYSAADSFSGQSFDPSRSTRIDALHPGFGNQNSLGSFSLRGNQGSPKSLFSLGGRETKPLDSSSAAPFELPSLSQLWRRGSSAPPGPRFSSKDALKFGSIFDDSTPRFSTTTMFTDSDLGNGVRFSAGTDFGSHRAIGAPVAGAGPAGTSKQSGASLAFKLSF